MFKETKYLDTASGARLAYHNVDAAGSARATILISHGLAEHSLRYDHFAEAMANGGFHVYAHDHRGHGETTSANSQLGLFARRDGARKVIDDLLALAAHASERHSGLPTILFGHSMGGLIALNAAVFQPDRFDAVAIWNSDFNLGIGGHFAKAVLKAEKMLKGSDTPSLILSKATFGAWGKAIDHRRTEFDWLSNNPEVVDRFIADPLCGFEPCVGMWLDVVEFGQAPIRPGQLERLPKSLPIHLVGGKDDPATHGGRDVTWLADHLRHKGFTNVDLTIYENTRHETLNDTVKAKAIADFANWCQAHTAPRPQATGTE